MSHREEIVVVIDSNVLLVIISSRSKYHWLYELILNGKIVLALPEARFITIYFNLLLITADTDDKFADCAFGANADYIITHDSDFNILKSIDFSKIPIVDINAFRKIAESHKLL